MSDNFLDKLLTNRLYNRKPENFYQNEKYASFWPGELSKNPSAIQFMSDEIKNNIEMCKIAISQDPFTLQYMGDDTKNNIEVCKLAFTNCMRYIDDWWQYLGEKIKNDKEFCKYVAINHANFIEHLNYKFKNNDEFCADVFAHNKLAIEYMSDSMKHKIVNKDNIIDLILETSKSNCSIWRCLSIEMQLDITNCRKIAFYNKDNRIFIHAQEHILRDKEIRRILLMRDPIAKFVIMDKKNSEIYDYICAMKKLAALYSANEDFFEYGHNDVFFEMIYNALKMGAVPAPITPQPAQEEKE